MVIITAALVDNITHNLPAHPIYGTEDWEVTRNLHLADPSFHKPGHIDTLIGTSKYPPHSGAIGLSSYGMGKATLPHFTNGHLFCCSFVVTASLPQKEMIYLSLFAWLNNVC